MQPSDEIKQKLDIVDLIRDYIQLKPAGVNFRALCPFHREKTPSFMVSPDKQIWHCFGCSKGGDHFAFVMEIEGLSFVEALRQLAPRAGVALRRQDPKLTSQRNRLLDIMESATSYYYKNLIESKNAEAIRKYLKGRGVKDETIDEWQIGYSPDSWDDMINLLKGKGFTENEIFLAGMSVKKEGTGRFYNRFRDRIMFPLRNVNGQVVAFSARVNPAKEETEKMGKYINSPQTMIYDKSRILFGLDKAKLAIKKEDKSIIVEGQTDVITAHQQDFKNVVASSGTALTHDQLVLLKRYSNNISLAFDMDEAGQVAADRGIFEALGLEMNVKVILVPGKDPDECIRNNPEEWKQAVEAARPMMEYYFSKNLSKLDLDQVEDKRVAAKVILNIISKIGNKIEQDFWLKKLSEETDVEEKILREDLAKVPPGEVKRAGKTEPAPVPDKPRKSREEALSELLIALMLKFSGFMDYVASNVYVEQLAGQENKLIYKNLLIYYNNVKEGFSEAGKDIRIDYSEFKDWLEKELILTSSEGENKTIGINQLQLLDRLVLLGDKDYYDIQAQEAKQEIIKIIITLKKKFFLARMKEIEKEIAQFEKEGDNERVNQLMEELKTLGEEVRDINEE